MRWLVSTSWTAASSASSTTRTARGCSRRPHRSPPSSRGSPSEMRKRIMRRVLVRYKVKSDRVAEHEQLVAGVFEELQRERPAGLRYETFKLDDGVSFVHVAVHETESSSALTELRAFKAFTANIKERCEEPPVSTRLNAVGAYMFGDAIAIGG